MKTNKLMIVAVALLGLLASCVPIDPNWSPEQQAQVQNSNAQMVQSAGIGLLGAGATLMGAAQLNNSFRHYDGYYDGGHYWYGGRRYLHRGHRHGGYYYY